MAVVLNLVGAYNGKALNQATRDLAQLRKEAAWAGSDTAGKMQIAGKSISSMGDKAAAVGGKLTLGVTAPLALVGWSSLKAAGNFEQSMNVLQQNSGASGKEIEKLRGLAMKMGADTVFSAKDAADAMLELSKAGLKPAQIEGGALQATMALAATEGMGLADAATVASNAMNTFGLKAKDSAQIADALAGASVASTASVASLSQALSQVGPGATNAGLSLQDTVGALAAFDNAGIKGSDAGTSLKTMLARLVPQTDKAAGAMADLGLKFTDSKGNILPLTDVAGQLQGALKDLSDEQRISALNTIFGSDATRAATVLMKEGADGLGKYIDAASQSGAAQKMADARMKGWNGTIEQLKGSVETLQIALGTELQPVATDVANKIKGVVDKFTALDAGTKQVIVKAGLLVAALGPVLWVLGKITSAVGKTISALSKFGGAIGKTYSGLKKIPGAAKQAATGIVNSGKSIAGAAKSGWETLRLRAMFARDAMSRAAASAKAGATSALNLSKQLVLTAAGYLKAGAMAAGAAVKTALATVAQKVAAGASKAWAAAQWLLNAALTANPIGLVIAAIALLVGAFVLAYKKIGWFRTGVQAAFGVMKNVIVGTLNVIKRVVGTVFGWIKTAVVTYFNIYKAVILGVWNGIKTVTTTVWGFIKGGISGALNGIRSLVSTVMGKVKGAWESVWGGMKSFVGNVWDGILGAVKAPINALIGIVNGLIGRLNSISVKVPDVPGVPMRGQTIGFNIPKIPELAKGAVINATPGGTVARIGEGRYDEAVLPLSPRVLGRLGGGRSLSLTVNVDARGATDPAEVDRRAEAAVRRAWSEILQEAGAA